MENSASIYHRPVSAIDLKGNLATLKNKTKLGTLWITPCCLQVREAVGSSLPFETKSPEIW